jgi:hypothetical protein
MHQVMVWAKAAHHHGASGITFSSATRVIFSTQKVYDKKMVVAKPLLNLQWF